MTATDVQNHQFSVPGAREEILSMYGLFKNIEMVHNPEDYDVDVLIANKDDFVGEVKSAYKATAKFLIDLIVGNESSAEDKIICRAMLTTIAKELGTFLSRYHAKCLQVQTPDTSLNPNRDRSLAGSSVSAQPDQAEKVRMAKVEVDIDEAKLNDAMESLTIEIKKEDDWVTVDSNKVEVAMGHVTRWRERLEFMKSRVWDIQKNTQTYNLDSQTFDRVEMSLNTIVGETEAAISAIEEQDQVRCLYSGLDKSKVSPIKYPVFSGAISEDYVKWERETRDALVKNRVRTEDKVKVIRTNLSGKPLKLIPDTMTNPETLFSALGDLYGEPSRVMRTRKDQLKSLGEFPLIKPGKSARNQMQGQVEWLLSAELYLSDIFELAKLSPDMDRAAFNPDSYREVLESFPMDVSRKMTKVQGRTQDKMEHVLQVHVKDKRTELQQTLKFLKEG